MYIDTCKKTYCSMYLCMHTQAYMLTRSGVVELLGQKICIFQVLAVIAPLPCKYTNQFTPHPPTCESAPLPTYLLTHCDIIKFDLAHLRGKKKSISL